MSYFTVWREGAGRRHRAGLPPSPYARRPHCSTGYERHASDEKYCFDPHQYPIVTHGAPQSLDCPE